MNEIARPLPGSLPLSSSSMSPIDHSYNNINSNIDTHTNTPDPKAFKTFDTMNTPLQTPFSPAAYSNHNSNYHHPLPG